MPGVTCDYDTCRRTISENCAECTGRYCNDHIKFDRDRRIYLCNLCIHQLEQQKHIGRILEKIAGIFALVGFICVVPPGVIILSAHSLSTLLLIMLISGIALILICVFLFMMSLAYSGPLYPT
jgi:hypothetical protein